MQVTAGVAFCFAIAQRCNAAGRVLQEVRQDAK
jgi:hypothetical protein